MDKSPRQNDATTKRRGVVRARRIRRSIHARRDTALIDADFGEDAALPAHALFESAKICANLRTSWSRRSPSTARPAPRNSSSACWRSTKPAKANPGTASWCCSWSSAVVVTSCRAGGNIRAAHFTKTRSGSVAERPDYEAQSLLGRDLQAVRRFG